MSRQNGFSPEQKLLLFLARGGLTPEVQDNARSLLRQGVCWSLILRQARVHGVFPLLYRNLQILGFPGVPADVRTELETTYRMNALRNTLLARELTQVLRPEFEDQRHTVASAPRRIKGFGACPVGMHRYTIR